ncbi:MAG: hypothetical protein ACRER1_00965 [Gammaproteobacteria bacterium]
MMRMFAVLAFAFVATACAPTARQAFGPRLDQARADGIPLLVYALGVPGEIAVGTGHTAVPVYVQFVVTSKRSLANVRFTLTGYTVRGIPVRRRGLQRAIELLGPGVFNPDGNYEVNTFHTRPAGFPGGDVACVEIVRMEILYADGERKSYDAKALRALLLPSLRKGCGDQGPTVNYRISSR